MGGMMALMGGGHGAAASGGGGGGSWNPATYGTVLGWWDGSDTTKVLDNTGASAANGIAIATITDKGPSSYSATQSTGGARPTLVTNVKNGLQVIRCAGASWMGLASGGSLTQNQAGFTVIAVHSIASLGSERAICYFEDHAANNRLKCSFDGGGDWHMDGNRVDSSTSYAFDSGGSHQAATATWYVSVWVIDYTNDLLNVHANNVSQGSAGSLGLGGGLSSNTGSLEVPTLFSSGLYGSGLYNGDIGEIAIIAGALNSTNIGLASTAAGAKWGMTI